MPRYRVLSGQHRNKRTGNMVKAGRTFFSEAEDLDKDLRNKLERVSEDDETRKKKKKRLKARKAEVEEDEVDGEEVKKKKKKGKKDKKGKKSRSKRK
jgi:hypothetical protein